MNAPTKPLLHRYDWTLEFARTVHHLRPSQQIALLDNMRAARAQQNADPAAQRVIWIEDERGSRRPYTPADDIE
ncbi:MAG: hypothetical protein IT330_07450 [Anaerolineae bacterium]|nr:hypothetical protein [Anaerolineae bacterium]